MATEVRKSDRLPGSRPVAEVTYNTSTLIYGRSGSGKTTLASTWPKPILYLNIRDNGTESIADVEDIDVKEITTGDEFKEVLLWCAKQANRGKLAYRTIVLDTMSQLQTILVEELCAKKEAMLRKNKKMPGDYGTLTLQEWGLVAGDLKAAIMDVRNLPVESVFIAQERTFNMPDEEGEENIDQIDPEVGAKLMKSVKNDLNASVSIICRTFIRLRVEKKKDESGKRVREVKVVYCLLVGPHSVYTTKLRKPKGVELPDYIEDPTFRKINKLRKGPK